MGCWSFFLCCSNLLNPLPALAACKVFSGERGMAFLRPAQFQGQLPKLLLDSLLLPSMRASTFPPSSPESSSSPGLVGEEETGLLKSDLRS